MRAPDPAPARVWGFCRVSGDEQASHGTGLEAQEGAIRRACDAWGWPAPIVRVEVESGSPEAEERRVVQRALVAEARPGDVILVALVDRWSRDAVYTLRSVRALVAAGVGWRSVLEHVDAATPHGDEVLGYRALAADHERRRIMLRTVGRRRELLEAGYWCHGARPPFGYARGSGPDKLAHLVLEPVPADVAVLLELYRQCVAGASVEALAEWLADVRPERGWSGSLVKVLLRSRGYLGEIRAPSGWVAGRHPAIVPRDIWEAAQEAKRGRDKGGRRPGATSRTATWLLRPGLARCGHCGARMRSAFGRRPEYAYHLCRDHCGAPMLRAADVDAALAPLILARLRELRAALSEPAAAPPNAPRPRDFQADRQRLAAALERAQRLAVDGLLEPPALARERDRIAAAVARLDAEERTTARTVAADSPAARAALLADVGRLERAWRRAPVEVRRGILETLVRAVVLRHGEPPAPEWRTPRELAVEHSGRP